MIAINRRWRITRGALVLCALTAMAGVASAADVPESLSKLKGSSDANAGEAMARAGYQMQGAKESWSRKDSFWWSEKNRQCLRLTSRFSFVSGVASVGTADCSGVAQGGGIVPGQPGTLTASDLLGLSRKGGEARLAAAGFNSIWIDEGKPDGVYMMWFNQRTGQCIAATVVGDKFDLAQDQPTSKCR